MASVPQRGDFVRVRSRRWLVEDERPIDGLKTLRLACVDDDAQGELAEVLWDAEIDGSVLGMKAGPASQIRELTTPASFRLISARSVGTRPRRLTATCFRPHFARAFTRTLISCFHFGRRSACLVSIS
jgi:hypothetical protein